MSQPEKKSLAYQLSTVQAEAIDVPAEERLVPPGAWPSMIVRAALEHDRFNLTAIGQKGSEELTTKIQAGVAQSVILGLVHQTYDAVESGYGPRLAPLFAEQQEAFAVAGEHEGTWLRTAPNGEQRLTVLPQLEAPLRYHMAAKAAGILFDIVNSDPAEPVHVPLTNFSELDQEAAGLGDQLPAVS